MTWRKKKRRDLARMVDSDRVGVASLVCLALMLLSNGILVHTTEAASSADFSTASSAIAAGFVATHYAERQGGNGSALTAELNTALGLVATAQAENSTAPTAAAAALANATQIAKQVQAQAPRIGKTGSAARQTTLEESLGGSVAILAISSLIYLFGERVFNSVWFYFYEDYIVSRPPRPSNQGRR
jgi:hypothetical protein